MSGAPRMNPVHRFFWNLLMRRRRSLRYLAARFPMFAPWAVRLRFVAHLLVGNIHASTGLLVMIWLALSTGWAIAAVVAAMITVVGEIVLQAGFALGVSRARGLGWCVGWREGWSTRAYLPAAWTDGAVKTPTVQAEVGTSSEPTAAATLRPIADHPKLSLVPHVEWPTVSYWVGPPPGRTFTALDEMAEILAAHLPRCHKVTVDYQRTTDSVGRISFTFADVLHHTEDTTTETTPVPAATPATIPAGPNLSLVKDDDHLGLVSLGALPGDDLPESA